MAKKQIFKRKKERDYLAELEELLKKNKGTGLYEAFDVNPRAFRIGGRVVDPSGLGQDVMRDDIKFAPYDYSTIPMNAPNTQVDPYMGFDTTQIDQQINDLQSKIDQQINDLQSKIDQQTNNVQSGNVDFNSYEGLQQVIDEITSVPVAYTNDGGTLYSNGIVRYDDGTSRQATRQDVPQVIATFSNGSVLLDNGLFLDPKASVGRGYSGLEGLSNLIFGTQARVTQEYGNQNPQFYGSQGHRGTDFGTRDLTPEQKNITLPFDVKVVQIIKAESGSPYGNSVLLELPNGSMLRLSHLSDMENFNEGNIVRAFDYIGTPGNTGRSTAEHLDVEYYNPDGQLADSKSFWLDSVDYVDQDTINQSLQAGKESLKPEEQQWLEDQLEFIEQGIPANPMYALGQPRPDFSQAQQVPPQYNNVAQAGANLIDKINPTGEFDLGITELMRNDPVAAQQALEATVQKYSPIEAEFGFSENPLNPFSKESEQARISALSQQPKTPYEERSLFGKIRQLGGNIMERVGDIVGIPETGMSEAFAGGATKKTNQAMANEIGGERPEEVPGIKQNIKDIGADIANRVTQTINPVVTKVGEGLDTLKQKTSNIYQKPSIMGLFQGQKQVGDITPGTSIIKTAGQGQGTPQPDAFFKYGGANQYAQYLVDNAEQARGGALDTALFTPEFYQDPNKIANVFGETSQGKEATNKYKEYLKSQIKPGYDQPYRTEQKQEGDTLYEYKIPIPEYFQNQYYQNLLAETPDTLKSGFSFDQFQLPTTTKSVSEYKGQVPVKDSLTPIFKSGVVDLFRRSNSNLGQLAGNVLKSPAGVYQPSQQSARFEVPETTRSIFQIPSPSSVVIPPTSIQKTIIKQPEPVKQPTLSDYLARGKTEAQWYAETGQQSTLDAINRAKAFTSPQSIANFNSQIISSVSPEQARRIGQSVVANRAQEKAQGGIKLPSGAISTVAPATQSNTSGASAQLSGNVNNSKSVFSSAADWLKKLFKK